MNIAIQKATELGVAKIIPCITEYTNIRNIRINNLYDNAIEAAEQSERLDVPKIENKIDLNLLLSKWPPDRKLIYCDEGINSDQSIIKILFQPKEYSNKWIIISTNNRGKVRLQNFYDEQFIINSISYIFLLNLSL